MSSSSKEDENNVDLGVNIESKTMATGIARKIVLKREEENRTGSPPTFIELTTATIAKWVLIGFFILAIVLIVSCFMYLIFMSLKSADSQQSQQVFNNTKELLQLVLVDIVVKAFLPVVTLVVGFYVGGLSGKKA